MAEKKAKLAHRKVNQKNEKEKMIDLEMSKYLEMDSPMVKIDPLKWWCSTGRKLFPLLFEAATKFLIIPATSVPSERVFSVSGEVLRKKRRRLGHKSVNRIVRLHTNLKKR